MAHLLFFTMNINTSYLHANGNSYKLKNIHSLNSPVILNFPHGQKIEHEEIIYALAN